MLLLIWIFEPLIVPHASTIKGNVIDVQHEDPQATFFCDQHDFLVATDALFSKGDKRISCCGNLISTLISGQKT